MMLLLCIYLAFLSGGISWGLLSIEELVVQPILTRVQRGFATLGLSLTLR